MNATTTIRPQCSGQPVTRYSASSPLVFAVCACSTVALLLAASAPATAEKISARTGQPQLSARQTARLDKLDSDTRSIAIGRAARVANQPLYRRVIPLRPNWLAAKGQQ